MKFKIIDVAQVGLFSALAFVGGYLFIAVPNVEIITAVIFVAGVYLGPKKGLLVGLLGQSLYSTLNPHGVSPPPLFIAQVLNRMLLGYVGGRWQMFLSSRRSLPFTGLVLGSIGLTLTWLFDITTDFSIFFLAGFSIAQMKTTFTLGLPFYLVHGLVNLLIFALVLPVVLRGLQQLQFPKMANSN